MVQNGIGPSGVAALKEFAAKGGTIVAFDKAGMLFTREFALPVRNALDGLKTEDFWVPSSLLRIEVDNTQPLGYGMPEEATAMFIQSAAFSPQVAEAGDSLTRIVARYPRDHVLLQGAMRGSEQAHLRPGGRSGGEVSARAMWC